MERADPWAKPIQFQHRGGSTYRTNRDASVIERYDGKKKVWVPSRSTAVRRSALGAIELRSVGHTSGFWPGKPGGSKQPWFVEEDHATKKKSPAQLDREIDEVVPGWARGLDMTESRRIAERIRAGQSAPKKTAETEPYVYEPPAWKRPYIPGQEYEFATVDKIEKRIEHLKWILSPGRYQGPGRGELATELEMLEYQWLPNALVRERQMGTRSHATKKRLKSRSRKPGGLSGTTRTSKRAHATTKEDEEVIRRGVRDLMQRGLDARNRFIDYAMEHGRLTRDQAKTALAAFSKARVIKFNAVSGTFHVTHGGFLDPDVIRRAAGVEE